MASTNKITEIIAAIKTIYPYYAKDANVQMLVKTWGVLLRDYADSDVDTALYMCLQTCKMPPTPADLIEKLTALRTALEPSDEELWNEVTKALRKGSRLVYQFRFNAIDPNGLTQGENARRSFTKLWESLPEKVKMYFGGKGEFQRLATTHDDEELKYERNRFMKVMPTIQVRHEYKQLNLALEAGSDIGALPERKMGELNG